ncbi:DsrE family protein [Streptomyces sp. SBT349]|uniref:DsrE family protein n=1 Tax=Streptomyces sp. SBT349 TaxID=1580539 RepID=UPI00069EA776|nr:DsrE family protein [Streptomyces sp. SBT349]
MAQPGRAEYLLIESRAAATADGAGFCRDALLQARAGHGVLLFLLQDGVTMALPGRSAEVKALGAEGGRIWVDGFSLAQRGLADAALLPAARIVDVDAVAGALLDPDVRVVWH